MSHSTLFLPRAGGACLAFLVFATGACSNSGQPAGSADGASGLDKDVTYQKDIRPIMAARCEHCHFDGGAGGFPLTSYDEVQALGALVTQMVTTREMPPWLADASSDDCMSIQDDQRLSDDQLALFQRWQELDFPEGDKKDYVAPELPRFDDLGKPNMKIRVPKPQPLSQNWEQYIDTPMGITFDEDTYVLAIDLVPQHVAVVHHAIVGLESCDAVGPGNIYSYRPGASTVVFGKDTALLIPKGSTLCTQFHYNTLYQGEDIPATEQSTIRLWTLPKGKKPKYLIARHANHNLFIAVPPGAEDVDATSTISATTALNTPPGVDVNTAQIVGMTPHMHALGVRFRETLKRADGSRICLVNVPRWDWEWQFDYMFNKGIPIKEGDQIEQVCTYSNTPENQLTDENGRPLAPKYTTFGQGTRDEMCLGYIWTRYKML